MIGIICDRIQDPNANIIGRVYSTGNLLARIRFLIDILRILTYNVCTYYGGLCQI